MSDGLPQPRRDASLASRSAPHAPGRGWTRAGGGRQGGLHGPLATAWPLFAAALLGSLWGCVPPMRTNVATPDVSGDGAADGAGTAGDVSDGAADADTDGAADQLTVGDHSDGIGEVGDAVLLPKGCTADHDCSPLVAEPCKLAACDKATGICTVTAAKNGLACDAGDACVELAACKGGACAGVAKSCDDGNVCTADRCAATSGCVHDDNKALCDDGNPCTQFDSCAAGVCGGAIKACAETPCAKGACNPKSGECAFADKPKGTPCDDGKFCTQDDACAGKECVGAPRDCGDGDPCTLDLCPPIGAVTCLHVAVAGPTPDCAGADLCEQAACVEGACVKTPKSCDDKNPCTADTCTAGTCTNLKLAAGACDDGDPCTAADACEKGQCKGSGDVSCDDGNPCTDDTCSAYKGCVHPANAKVCNDGSACTSLDACVKGKCVGVAKSCDDGNPCTSDGCDPATAKCKAASVADGTPCAGGTCQGGACAGAP